MKEKLSKIIKWVLILGIGGSLPMFKRGDFSGIYIVGGIAGICFLIGLFMDYEEKLKNEKRHIEQ